MSYPQLSRKELKQPDTFVVQTGNFFKTVHENIMLILLCLGILFLIAVGAVYYHSSKTAKAEHAFGQFYAAKQALEKSLQNIPITDSTWEAKVKAELEQIKNIPNKFNKTLASYEVLFLLGNLYFERANAAKAAEYYEKAITLSDTRKLRLIALYSLASVYENSGKYDASLEAFSKILSVKEENPLRGEALLATARDYVLKGDMKKAAEQYDLVTIEFPNSPLAQSARLQKGRLH